MDKWWSGTSDHRWGEKTLTTDTREARETKEEKGDVLNSHVRACVVM